MQIDLNINNIHYWLYFFKPNAFQLMTDNNEALEQDNKVGSVKEALLVGLANITKSNRDVYMSRCNASYNNVDEIMSSIYSYQSVKDIPIDRLTDTDYKIYHSFNEMRMEILNA